MDLKVVKQDLFIGPKIKKIVSQRGGVKGSEYFLDKIALRRVQKNWFFSSFDKFVFSADNDIQFDFNDKNKIQNMSYYLGAGAFTAVYGVNIKNIKHKSEFNSELFSNKDKLILRVFDDNNLNEFIKNWIIHKKLYPENIIDIYLHGNVYIIDGDEILKLGQYVITREYYDHTYILENFDLGQKMKLILSILEFLEKIKNKYQYYDLKLSNIGCDLNKDKITLILLDYDKTTLSKNPINYTNTYFPLCVLNGDKDNIHLGGLSEIIYRLFYKLDQEQTYKILTDIYNLVKWINGYRKSPLTEVYPLMKSSVDSINRKIINLSETSLYLYILLAMISYPSITQNVSKFYDITNLKNLVYTSIHNSFDQLKAGIESFIVKIKQEIEKDSIDITPITAPSIDDKTRVITQPEAEKTRVIAQPEAEKTRVIAQPEAEKTRVIAQPEAEKTRVIKKNITSDYSLGGGYTNQDNYKRKYLKYKQKYLQLKNI
jgi:hypothetical protein